MNKALEQKLSIWNAAVREQLQNPRFDSEPAYLFDPMRYALNGEGKMLRPALCLASAEAVGGAWSDALTVAVALEIFHTFTLVHDDIMDGDELRRGTPTVHKAFDQSRALLGGDAMLIYMYQLLSDVPQETFHKIYGVFNAGAMDVCKGQGWDMQFENAPDVDPKQYEKMIDLKTGALIKLACELGAILGGANPETVDALGRFGLLLGRAFQMQDDLLELTSTAQTMGKSLGSDVLNEKKTWIWLDLQRNLSETERSSWDKIKDSQTLSDEDRKQVMIWMESHGTLDRAQGLVSTWITEADAILGSEHLKDSDMLKGLSDIILNRTH